MMITLVRNLLLVIGGALLVIGIIDVSPRGLAIGAAFLAAAWAAHRRSRAFWWIASGVLAFSLCASLREFFRGPQTPLAYTCSTLSTLLLGLISSWWFRQKVRFDSPLTSR